MGPDYSVIRPITVPCLAENVVIGTHISLLKKKKKSSPHDSDLKIKKGVTSLFPSQPCPRLNSFFFSFFCEAKQKKSPRGHFDCAFFCRPQNPLFFLLCYFYLLSFASFIFIFIFFYSFITIIVIIISRHHEIPLDTTLHRRCHCIGNSLYFSPRGSSTISPVVGTRESNQHLSGEWNKLAFEYHHN